MGDAGVDLRIAERLGGDLVDVSDAIEQAPPASVVDARRVAQIEDRIADRAQLDALMDGRQEAAAPEAAEERLIVRIAGALA